MSEPKADLPKLIVKKGSPTLILTKVRKLVKLPNNTIDWRKSQKALYDEQVIYTTTNSSESIKKGDYRSLVLKNQQNKLTNNNRTTATFITYDHRQVIKTSDKIVKLIGNKNYNSVFIALCSVISQELKIRAMLALLTEETTDDTEKSKAANSFTDQETQTTEICKDIFFQKKRRIKPQRVVSEVKKTTPKCVVINPPTKNLDKHQDVAKSQSLPILPDLNLDEGSNASLMSPSQLSVCSDILNTEMTKLVSVTKNSILNTEDSKKDVSTPRTVPESKKSEAEIFSEKYNPSVIEMLDGSRINVPVKPEDQFHLATPEILRHITSGERKKLLWHQAYIDWKLCLERDEEGNMPLHVAVLHNDVDLIRRQCLVLRARGQDVDITANGMTALELSIKNNADPACTKTLLDCGASPLRCDSDERNALHQAALAKPGHMREILTALAMRAREITEDYEEFQHPGVQDMSDDDLVKHLLLQVSVLYDNEGYTPLILACKAGNTDVVELLAAAAPQTVNTPMPNSGNTALYTAVAAACMDTVERGDKKTVPANYLKTIETLIDHGAEPEIENRSGAKVSDLLQEFGISSLSLLVAKKITSKFFDGDTDATLRHDTFMLFKDSEGTVKLIPNTDAQKKADKRVKKKPTSDGRGDVSRVFTVNMATPVNSSASTLDPNASVTKNALVMSKESYFINPGPKQPRILPKNVIIRQVDRPNSSHNLSSQTFCGVQPNSQANMANGSYYILKTEQGNVNLTLGHNVVKSKVYCPTVGLTAQNTAVVSNVNSPNVSLTAQNTNTVVSNVNRPNVSLTAQNPTMVSNVNSPNDILTAQNSAVVSSVNRPDVSLTAQNTAVASKVDCSNVSLTVHNATGVSNVNSPNVSLTAQNPTVASEVNYRRVSLTARDISLSRNVNCTNASLTVRNVKPQIIVPNSVNSAAVRPSTTTSKRSASPRNVNSPELSKTEKCQKRKSRILTTEKEKDKRKKLKAPE